MLRHSSFFYFFGRSIGYTQPQVYPIFFTTVSFIYYKCRAEETIQKGNVMKSKILGFLVQLLIAIIQGIIVSIVSQLIIKLIL